jgi:hypothetical protein
MRERKGLIQMLGMVSQKGILLRRQRALKMSVFKTQWVSMGEEEGGGVRLVEEVSRAGLQELEAICILIGNLSCVIPRMQWRWKINLSFLKAKVWALSVMIDQRRRLAQQHLLRRLRNQGWEEILQLRMV